MMSIAVYIFSFTYMGVVLSQQCLQPTVHKRTIIRSAESIQNGAILLHKLVVSSARVCYEECCKSQYCNVAVMHYKEEYAPNGNSFMKKYCFMFDCKNPSVCSYDEHSGYAIIEISKLHTQAPLKIENPSISNKPVTDILKPLATTDIPLENHDEEKCPLGVPVAMCADDPCLVTKCESHKDAFCKRNYCGGCSANFYDEGGNRLQCSTVSPKKTGEEVEVASASYEETPVESLPLAPNKSAKATDKGEKDPYFQSDRRQWVDGNEPGHLINASVPKTTKSPIITTSTVTQPSKVIFVNNSFMSIPLLIALCICIMLIVGLIYRFRCAGRGKPKKFPVDDGDYLINGMYL